MRTFRTIDLTSVRWPLVGLALAASACGGNSNQNAIEFRVPVDAQEVKVGDVQDRIVVTGTLRAAELATLTVETTGILKIARGPSGRWQEGDKVARGQVLAEVAGEDVTLAARAEASQRRFEATERDLEAKRKLYAEGLITQLELKNAESTAADAKNELDRSRLTESRTRLTTPVSGTILKLARDQQGLPIADGQRVVVGTVLAQVAPLQSLIADVDLVGSDAARVKPGLKAEVRHHALGENAFSGTVTRLAPSLDVATRALRAEVTVDNSAALLRPGMFVEVTLIAESRQGVPVVPRSAVTERDGKKVVFVLKEQQVERRDVSLGLGDDATVEIAQGLKPGERIVTRGIETLSDGTKVRVSGS